MFSVVELALFPTVDEKYLEFQLAVLRALPRNIDHKVAAHWRENGEELARVLEQALLPPDPDAEPVPAPRPQLLIPIGTVDVAATTTPFVARDKFTKTTTPFVARDKFAKTNAVVKISHLDGDFEKWFLGKIEAPFAGSTLRYGKLSRNSIDGSIIKELGGEEKAETLLAEMFSLMEKQPNGESGVLCTDGRSHIFYIKDVDGVLRAVNINWPNFGWYVFADPVPDPNNEWQDEFLIFSRDSY